MIISRLAHISCDPASGATVFVSTEVDKAMHLRRFGADGAQLVGDVDRVTRIGLDERQSTLGWVGWQITSIAASSVGVDLVLERPIAVDDRLYFTLRVVDLERATSGRFIVAWSEARGIRPFAPVSASTDERGVRLEASNGRLSWVEQSEAKALPWSVPL